jgi:tRNA wybutosine-synthesizing protein 3
MTFDNEKQTFLAKQDKSVKGSIDSHIRQLCDLINSKGDFYTTSSCSGRIVLIKLAGSGKKNEAEWLFVSHDEAGIYNLKNELSALPEGQVWFRFEPFILHVAAKSTGDAKRLLEIVQSLGIKRSGIISLGNKIVIEIIGTERIDAIISKESKLLVSDDYLELLVEDANQKLRKNWEDIRKIIEALNKL